jgi:hypothetical protein
MHLSTRYTNVYGAASAFFFWIFSCLIFFGYEQLENKNIIEIFDEHGKWL